MTARLHIEIVRRDGGSRDLVLEESPAIVGRDRGVDVAISDRRASRRHAEIRWDASSVTVTDLESKNGTFVGEERIGIRGIEPESSFRAGDTTIRVVRLEPARDAAGEVASAGLPIDVSGPAGIDRSSIVVLATAAVLALGVVGLFLAGGIGDWGLGFANRVRINTQDIPSPARVAAVAERQVESELSDVVEQVGPDPVASGFVDSEGRTSPDVMLAELMGDGELAAIDQRVLEEDDSIVIVTFELTGPGLDSSLRWESAYERGADGIEYTSTPYQLGMGPEDVLGSP